MEVLLLPPHPSKKSTYIINCPKLQILSSFLTNNNVKCWNVQVYINWLLARLRTISVHLPNIIFITLYYHSKGPENVIGKTIIHIKQLIILTRCKHYYDRNIRYCTIHPWKYTCSVLDPAHLWRSLMIHLHVQMILCRN